MPTKSILYIVANGGTDTRVVKELKTLSQEYDMIFIGCNRTNGENFIRDYVTESFILSTSHRNPITYVIFNILVVYLRLFRRIHSVHVVDEQTYIPLMLACFGKWTVLDIFDSLFLKLNLPNERGGFIKTFLYGCASSIIVTDENRKKLLPHEFICKASVVPNYPFLSSSCSVKRITNNQNEIRIGCFGTLTLERGMTFLDKLSRLSSEVKVVCAGWIGDAGSKDLIENNPAFTYFGILKQEEILLAMDNIDFLCMMYPVNNLNNKFASPNKLYDAIHSNVPVICNHQIFIAKEILKNNFGIVCTSSEIKDPTVDFCALLKEFVPMSREGYAFFQRQYSWDNYEGTLLNCHVVR